MMKCTNGNFFCIVSWSGRELFSTSSISIFYLCLCLFNIGVWEREKRGRWKTERKINAEEKSIKHTGAIICMTSICGMEEDIYFQGMINALTQTKESVVVNVVSNAIWGKS